MFKTQINASTLCASSDISGVNSQLALEKSDRIMDSTPIKRFLGIFISSLVCS